MDGTPSKVRCGLWSTEAVSSDLQVSQMGMVVVLTPLGRCFFCVVWRTVRIDFARGSNHCGCRLIASFPAHDQMCRSNWVCGLQVYLNGSALATSAAIEGGEALTPKAVVFSEEFEVMYQCCGVDMQHLQQILHDA